MPIDQNILVATDTVLFTKTKKVLLISRLNPPFQNAWAFPGGFVEEDEDLPLAAAREMAEETCIELNPHELIQFGTYGKPGRDPRGRTISVVYYTIIDDTVMAKADDDAKEAQWFLIDQLPDMAFDHGEILQEMVRALSL